MTPALSRAVLVGLLLCSSLLGSDPRLLDLAQPGSNFVLGLNLSEITASPLFRSALEQATKSNPQWNDYLGLMGNSPFQKIEELVVVSSIDMAGAEAEPKDVLILARGNFGDETVKNLLCTGGCTSSQYRGMELYEASGRQVEQPGHFVILDPEYGALGTQQAVRSLVDRWSSGSAAGLSAGISEWVSRLGGHHIWLAAQGPFEAPAAAATDPGASIAMDAASKVDGLGLGVRLGQDVQVSLELESPTESAATELYQMTNGLLGLMMASQTKPENAGARQFLERLKLSQDGTFLAASLTVPADELTQQLEEAARKVAAPPQEGAAAGPGKPSVAAPSRRPKGKILILGLENDPVEVAPTQK